MIDTGPHLASEKLNGRYRFAAGEELAWLRGMASLLQPGAKVAIVGGPFGIVPLALLEGVRARIHLQLINRQEALAAAVTALKETGRYAQAELSLIGPGEVFDGPVDVLIVDADTPAPVTEWAIRTPVVDEGLVYVRHYTYAMTSRAGRRLEVKDVVDRFLKPPDWKMTVRVASAAGLRLYPEVPG